MRESLLYSSRPLMTLFDRDDAGVIAASSRWLRSVSATTPPDLNAKKSFCHFGRGARTFVVSSPAMLNHRHRFDQNMSIMTSKSIMLNQ